MGYGGVFFNNLKSPQGEDTFLSRGWDNYIDKQDQRIVLMTMRGIGTGAPDSEKLLARIDKDLKNQNRPSFEQSVNFGYAKKETNPKQFCLLVVICLLERPCSWEQMDEPSRQWLAEMVTVRKE